MADIPAVPTEVPPYHVKSLVDTAIDIDGASSDEAGPVVEVKCAQALGSEIFVGCSNGELLRFSLQPNIPKQCSEYTLDSRRTVLPDKPIDEIVLLPNINRALIFTDRQIHFFVLSTLDPIPPSVTKPVRNVIAFAVDHQQATMPAPPASDPPIPVDPVDFCVLKRNSISLYSIHERLFYHKDISLPETAFAARRSGMYVCIADRNQYSMVDLANASSTPLIMINQAPPDAPSPRIRPIIAVVSPTEFLIFSWNGASSMGLFISDKGDPVRGTVEFPSHPLSVSIDYPNLIALFPDQSISVLSIETQLTLQTLPPPPLPDLETVTSPAQLIAGERRALALSAAGYLVPSEQQSEKLRLRKVPLLGRNARPGGRESTQQLASEADLKSVNDQLVKSAPSPTTGKEQVEDDQHGADRRLSVEDQKSIGGEETND